MRYLAIVVMALLSLIASPANAGFFVQRPAPAVNQRTTTVVHPLSHKLVNERPQARSKWNVAAIILAGTGLLFPPFGVLAIVFGVLSLANGEKHKGLAITGLILGVAEILFMIFLLIALSHV